MSKDVRQLVGANIRRRRQQLAISQAELAVRLGVDRSYVSGLELGNRNPTLMTLHHVAEALGWPIVALFDDVSP